MPEAKAPLAEIAIPAREARVAEVEAGDVLRIIDPEGQQVGDFAAYLRDDPDEYFSPSRATPAASRRSRARSESTAQAGACAESCAGTCSWTASSMTGRSSPSSRSTRPAR